jgi:hypothetical protein
MTLTRRQALRLCLIPLAAPIILRHIGKGLVPAGDATGGRDTSLDGFRELFTDLRPPREIGHRYLRSFSQEGSREFLARALTGGAHPQDVQQLRALLGRQRERDFCTGDIAVIDGWVLSRTEARTCALITLL